MYTVYDSGGHFIASELMSEHAQVCQSTGVAARLQTRPETVSWYTEVNSVLILSSRHVTRLSSAR